MPAGVPGVHTWQLLVNMKMLKVLSHRRGRYGIVVVYKRRTAGCTTGCRGDLSVQSFESAVRLFVSVFFYLLLR